MSKDTYLALKGKSIIKMRDDRLKKIDSGKGSAKNKAEEKVFWIEYYDQQLKKYGIEGIEMTNKDTNRLIFDIRQAQLISSIDDAIDSGDETLFLQLTTELNRLREEQSELTT